MRTTISINDELLIAAKRQARERGITLGELVDGALQMELSRPASSTARPPIPVFRGGGRLQPGVDLNSNRAIAELLDEGLPLEKRR
jgi:hypothetical protein